MLVIRRRAGESFVIGGNVEVEILDVGSTQVKLGIRAPREVSVLRKEVLLAAQQNRAAGEKANPPEISELAKKIQS